MEEKGEGGGRMKESASLHNVIPLFLYEWVLGPKLRKKGPKAPSVGLL
jgi:hypothetical protein